MSLERTLGKIFFNPILSCIAGGIISLVASALLFLFLYAFFSVLDDGGHGAGGAFAIFVISIGYVLSFPWVHILEFGGQNAVLIETTIGIAFNGMILGFVFGSLFYFCEKREDKK